MTATRSKAQTRRRSAEPEPRGGGVNTNVLIGVGVAVAAAVLAAIVIFAIAGGDDDNSIGTTEVAAAGQVEVSGEPLPLFGSSGDDPAVGMVMPEITAPVLGAGNRITFANGRPRVLMFLAHWCPHCHDEVEAMTDWLDEGNQFPVGVDIQALSFRVDAGRGNFPVSSWLRDEGWPYTTLVDDENNLLDSTFGVGGTPFYIFVNADGTVAGRSGGEIGPDALATALTELEAGRPLTGVGA